MSNSYEWHTPRLLIRRFRPEDLDGFYELQGDPEATWFIGGPWTLDKTRQTLGAIIANYANRELEWHAVTLKDGGAVLGACWLGPLAQGWCEALGIPSAIELGYRYAKRFWGHGYATEAGAAMARRGFDELKLEQIVTIIRPENIASDRVIQKLGMRYQRSARREAVAIKFYTLDRSQWAAVDGR